MLTGGPPEKAARDATDAPGVGLTGATKAAGAGSGTEAKPHAKSIPEGTRSRVTWGPPPP